MPQGPFLEVHKLFQSLHLLYMVLAVVVVVVVVAIPATDESHCRRVMTLPDVSLQICVELYESSKNSNHWPLRSNSNLQGAIGSINSLYFHIIRDKLINPSP